MKKKYDILIAEDDILIAEMLKSFLEEFGHLVVGVVSSFEEFQSFLNLQPDFCFLDIRMHGKDEGFKIGEFLNENTNIPFMFLTSFSDVDTIQKASTYNPVGYLSKPFKKADILSALEIAMAKIKQEEKNKIEIKDGSTTHYIDPSDILFCKADNIYVEIQTKTKKIIERISLDKFSERLPDFFQKCHRSFIINTSEISSVEANEIRIGSFKVPLSRSFKQYFAR